MKLSICMIVKNEEANLQRCLDSLLPIIHMKDDETLENLTELIIVDTGSADRTVNVAKKYTDKVYIKEFIPWDFSAARNYGIAKAKGEYLLIIDADEELPQAYVYPLMDLILNPDINYPTIFIWVNNWHAHDGSRITPVRQPRIFKRDGFYYEQPVHNRAKAQTPYYFAEIGLNHYGYLFQDKELARKKTERSLPMLLAAHEKDPTDLHALTHLLKHLRIAGDYDKVIYYGEIWLTEIQKADVHEGWFGYWESYANLMEAHLIKGDIDNALRILDEAEKVSKRIIDLYAMLWNYYIAKDPNKAREYAERTLEIYRTRQNPYEELLASNAEIIIPRVLNYLAIYYYQKKDLMRAGQMINDGILYNKNHEPLRWDVWNERDIIGQAE